MEFIAADSRLAILSALDRFGGDACIMAGGTYLMMQIARAEVAPRAVINAERVRDLATIEGGNAPRVGSMVTLRTLADAPALASYAGLRQAAALCGGWQTQSVGTLGGNICYAAPTADLVPPLLVHNARVVLETAGTGSRVLPLEDFILGAHRTARGDREMLVAVELEPVPARTADVFEKVGRRSAMEIAIASLAIRLTLAADGMAIEHIRIAVGAVADMPFRAREAEAILTGEALSTAGIAAAGDAILRASAPQTDSRASAAYRAGVLPRVFARAVHLCARAAATEL